MFELDARDVAVLLENSSGASHVEDLCLTGDEGTGLTFPDIQALITRPKALKNFTCQRKHDEDRDGPTIPIVELWSCLRKHKQSLETIDIYRGVLEAHVRGGHCGPFREFTSLKHLSMEVGMILGGCAKEPIAPFRLRDTLPSTLQSLTLYGCHVCMTNTDLPAQLQELVRGDFPLLDTVVLEDSRGPYILVPRYRNMKLLHRDFEQTCRGKGIKFRFKIFDRLTKSAHRHEEKANILDGAYTLRYAVQSLSQNIWDPQEVLPRFQIWADVQR